MNDISIKEENPIIIENFNPKNFFNDNDLKKINDNNKLKITNIGKYSITKPIHTSWIKTILINFFKNKNINTKSLNLIDSTAGIGGDTISFSKYFKNILSIEKDKIHFELLKNNLDVLDIKNVKIENNDFVSILDNLNLVKNDYSLLYIDPPWGGPNYKNLKNIDLFIINNNDEKIYIKDIINKNYYYFDYIILKSPININFNNNDYLYKNIYKNIDKDNKILLFIFEK